MAYLSTQNVIRRKLSITRSSSNVDDILGPVAVALSMLFITVLIVVL